MNTNDSTKLDSTKPISHTPESDRLAAVIQRRAERLSEQEARGVTISPSRMGRHDGMNDAWEIITNVVATEDAIADAAMRHYVAQERAETYRRCTGATSVTYREERREADGTLTVTSIATASAS